MPEGWLPFLRRQWDEYSPYFRQEAPPPPTFEDLVAQDNLSLPSSTSDLVNRIRQQFSPTNIGKKIGENLKQAYQSPTPTTVGKALRTPTAISGRATGAMLDVAANPKKPVSDVLWEAGKGLKEGLSSGSEVSTPSKELSQRYGDIGIAPSLISDIGLDPSNLIPGEALAHGGMAAAKLLGMGGKITGEAAIPFWKLMAREGATGLEHGTGGASAVKAMAEEGADMTRQGYTDVVGRYFHSGLKGHPISSGFGWNKLPLTMAPEASILDVTHPVPAEDISKVLGMFPPPGKDANADRMRKEIIQAWRKQAEFVQPETKPIKGLLPEKAGPSGTGGLPDISYGATKPALPPLVDPTGAENPTALELRAKAHENQPWRKAVNKLENKIAGGPFGSEYIANSPFAGIFHHDTAGGHEYSQLAMAAPPTNYLTPDPTTGELRPMKRFMAGQTPQAFPIDIYGGPGGYGFSHGTAGAPPGVVPLPGGTTWLTKKEIAGEIPRPLSFFQQKDKSAAAQAATKKIIQKKFPTQVAAEAPEAIAGEDITPHIKDITDIVSGNPQLAKDVQYYIGTGQFNDPEILHNMAYNQALLHKEPRIAKEIDDLWTLKKEGIPEEAPEPPKMNIPIPRGAEEPLVTPDEWAAAHGEAQQAQMQPKVKISPKAPIQKQPLNPITGNWPIKSSQGGDIFTPPAVLDHLAAGGGLTTNELSTIHEDIATLVEHGDMDEAQKMYEILPDASKKDFHAYYDVSGPKLLEHIKQWDIDKNFADWTNKAYYNTITPEEKKKLFDQFSDHAFSNNPSDQQKANYYFSSIPEPLQKEFQLDYPNSHQIIKNAYGEAPAIPQPIGKFSGSEYNLANKNNLSTGQWNELDNHFVEAYKNLKDGFTEDALQKYNELPAWYKENQVGASMKAKFNQAAATSSQSPTGFVGGALQGFINDVPAPAEQVSDDYPDLAAAITKAWAKDPDKAAQLSMNLSTADATQFEKDYPNTAKGIIAHATGNKALPKISEPTGYGALKDPAVHEVLTDFLSKGKATKEITPKFQALDQVQQATIKRHHPMFYDHIKAASDKEQGITFDVFDQANGKTIYNTASEADAKAYIANNPQLDYTEVPYDPNLEQPGGEEDWSQVGKLPEPIKKTPEEWEAELGLSGQKPYTKVSPNFQLKESNPGLPGMNKKKIYTKGGQDYIFKTGWGSTPEWVANREVHANDIAKLGGVSNIDMSRQTLDGETGTMQSVLGNNTQWPSLRTPGHTDFTKLSKSELMDIIKNHPIDWLVGNHDNHPGQFLKTPTGIVEIDRGQAFKFYGKDKLSPSYNPNAKVEGQMMFPTILKMWQDGKLPQLDGHDIDAALMGTINKLKSNKEAVFKVLENVIADAPTHASAAESYAEMVKRFDNLEPDMVAYWSGKLK